MIYTLLNFSSHAFIYDESIIIESDAGIANSVSSSSHFSTDPKKGKVGTCKRGCADLYTVPPALSWSYTVKKQEAGVKLKMQDLRLFNLVFESDPIRAGYWVSLIALCRLFLMKH